MPWRSSCGRARSLRGARSASAMLTGRRVCRQRLTPTLGYDRAALVAQKALASDETSLEVCLEGKLLTRKELDRLLKPHHMAQPGINWSGRKFGRG
ncbi:MAG: hypothetical protein ACRD3T_08140 [Terriglobia bacterium]